MDYSADYFLHESIFIVQPIMPTAFENIIK